MHDYKFNQLPRSFNNVWRTVAESNIPYPMRNNQDYRIVRARICLTERLPISKFPKIWNEYKHTFTTQKCGSMSKPYYLWLIL